MKVHEIIQEDTPWGRAFAFLGKWLFKSAISKRAAEDLGKIWLEQIRVLKNGGKAVPNLAGDIPAIEAELKRLGYADDVIAEITSNPKLLKEIEKEALETIEKEFAKQGVEAAGKAANWLLKTGNWLAIGNELYNAYRDIKFACDKYNAKEINDKQLDTTVAYILEDTSARIIAIWAGQKVLGKVFNVRLGIDKLPLVGPAIGATWDVASFSSRTAWLVWLETDQGTKTFADWYLNQALVTGLSGEKYFNEGFRWLINKMQMLSKTQLDKLIKNFKPDYPAGAADPQRQKDAEAAKRDAARPPEETDWDSKKAVTNWLGR